MIKGIKFRIYPNKEQKRQIERTFGCCRLVFNMCLDMKERAYHNGEKLNCYKLSNIITMKKKTDEYAFLNDIDSMALQQSIRDLDTAYKYHFKNGKNLPRFKSKHNSVQTYRTQNNDNGVRIVGHHIRLPKIGFVKIRQTMEVGRIINVTVKRTSTGKYFAILIAEFEPKFKQNNGRQIGIDVGLKMFYTDSNGNKVDNPKHLEKSEKKLKREQRRLARKQKGSNNRNKQRIRFAKVHEKIANQRNDFLQKESTKLVRENQTIVVENLNIKGMMKNRKLAKSINSVSWYLFFEMLKYKTSWYGGELIKVPTTYPSSQICCVCGYKNKNTKNLSVRKWECPVCKTIHDRDMNASLNILKKGLLIA